MYLLLNLILSIPTAKIKGKITKISDIAIKTFTPGHYGIVYSQKKSSTIC